MAGARPGAGGKLCVLRVRAAVRVARERALASALSVQLPPSRSHTPTPPRGRTWADSTASRASWTRPFSPRSLKPVGEPQTPAAAENAAHLVDPQEAVRIAMARQ